MPALRHAVSHPTTVVGDETFGTTGMGWRLGALYNVHQCLTLFSSLGHTRSTSGKVAPKRRQNEKTGLDADGASEDSMAPDDD